MSDAAPPGRSPQRNELPYVGLRPFERHESNRLFGRGRDAQILCDRTLSGRLTILYAQSGLGKSSLLRALVVPKLEESHARVVYFDSWAQEDPWHALKEALIELASSVGVPEAGRGSPTLVELVRLINNVDDRSIVLVLDQFEEFLVHHGTTLDPLRSELAALVRSGVDAAVVLSLREEFLAALEPFRQQILNLFQAAYRLEPLAEADLREAIRRPAEDFGGRCNEDMAEQLIHDLRGGKDEPAGGVPLVELPMLQLVCQELWKHATNGQLTLELYRGMGGAGRILDGYVRDLMPKHSREQALTARLLVPLAPPSGLKMSYAVEDLSSMTGLDPVATAAELERLARARILRTRQHRGGQRYELEHDAFIPVLSSWRDHVLERGRRRQTIRQAMYIGGAVVAVTTALVSYFLLKAQAAEKVALFHAALSANDPLVRALALAEVGDSRTAGGALSELHEVATAAIPAAVLRDGKPEASGSPVVAGWFMADGKRVSTVSESGEWKAWSVDGRGSPDVLPFRIPANTTVTAVAVSADRQWIAIGLDNGEVQGARSTGTDVIHIPRSGMKVSALALSADGGRVLAGYADNRVRIWNRDGTPAAILGGAQIPHSGEISSVQFDAAGKRALTASLDGKVKIWSVDRPTTPLAVIGDDPHRGQTGNTVSARQIYSASFSPDGRWVICGLDDGAALIWRSEGKGDPVELKGHEEPVTSASFSPDSLRVVTGSQDRSARVWDLRLETGQTAAADTKLISVGSPMVLRGHASPVRAVGFSSDGSRIVTASDDGTARIWWSTSQEPRVLGRHNKPVEKVAFSPDGNRVASASRDKTVRIWPLDGSGGSILLEGHTDWVRSVAFSPDGTRVATGSEDGTASIWNPQTGRIMRSRPVGAVFSVAFTPDGAGIMTGTREAGDTTVKVWPDDSLQVQPWLSIDERKDVFCAVFSPDASRIVTASADGYARIWRREPGKWAIQGPPVQLKHRDRVFSAVFSPDGSKVATSSADRQAHIWSLSGSLLGDFSHLNEVWQIGFSSDAKWLLTSSIDGTAKIWDVEHGGLLLSLSHPSGLRAAAFRPKSSEVVTGADDGDVRLWRTDPGALLEYLRGASTACLAPPDRVRFLGESWKRAGAAYDACEAKHERAKPTN